MAGDIEVTESRQAIVGTTPVRRALPLRGRRTVGAWCFADHIGPVDVSRHNDVGIAPHPHMGLHTVTWLLEGELVHRDSLGSEQVIRPGQLNLMTAGHGIAHSEESTRDDDWTMHGIQLWVAQPDSTRHGPSAFEHHADLPIVELDRARGTVLVGEFGATRSTARSDTPLVGVDLDLDGAVDIPLEQRFEYGIVVLDGAIDVAGTTVKPGQFAYLGTGRDELGLVATDRSRLVLLGGTPFGERVLMFWNFVARSRDEVDAAYASWRVDDGRFGTVASSLPRIPSPAPPWGPS